MMGVVTTRLPPPRRMYGIRAQLAERWRLWRQRRRWTAEMANAAALGRLDDILNDVALTKAELSVLVQGPADAGRQFERFAEAEHVDLRRLSPEALREAIWVCIRCQCRSSCKRWLSTGIWDYDGNPRCPNAALLHK